MNAYVKNKYCVIPCWLDLVSNLTVHDSKIKYVNAKTAQYHASVDVQVTMDFKSHCLDRQLQERNMKHRFFLSLESLLTLSFCYSVMFLIQS